MDQGKFRKPVPPALITQVTYLKRPVISKSKILIEKRGSILLFMIEEEGVQGPGKGNTDFSALFLKWEFIAFYYYKNSVCVAN